MEHVKAVGTTPARVTRSKRRGNDQRWNLCSIHSCMTNMTYDGMTRLTCMTKTTSASVSSYVSLVGHHANAHLLARRSARARAKQNRFNSLHFASFRSRLARLMRARAAWSSPSSQSEPVVRFDRIKAVTRRIWMQYGPVSACLFGICGHA